ncbi:MAG: hypothetical protein ACJ748_02510 [Flavisolibacter sp.]
MNRTISPESDQERRMDNPYGSQLPDVTPRREGGDDSLAESSPDDSHSDEKVVVNQQRGNKTVNIPSQTAANTSEENSYDDELIDDSDKSGE